MVTSEVGPTQRKPFSRCLDNEGPALLIVNSNSNSTHRMRQVARYWCRSHETVLGHHAMEAGVSAKRRHR